MISAVFIYFILHFSDPGVLIAICLDFPQYVQLLTQELHLRLCN